MKDVLGSGSRVIPGEEGGEGSDKSLEGLGQGRERERRGGGKSKSEVPG